MFAVIKPRLSRNGLRCRRASPRLAQPGVNGLRRPLSRRTAGSDIDLAEEELGAAAAIVILPTPRSPQGVHELGRGGRYLESSVRIVEGRNPLAYGLW